MRKICVVCGNEFDACRSSVCCSKTCSSDRRLEYMAKYREENRERLRERWTKYYAENRERKLKYRAENRERARDYLAQRYRNKRLTINDLKARGEEL